MTTLYLKIDEREILSANFRAYNDGSGGSAEAYIALELASGIQSGILEMFQDGLVPESFKTEGTKLLQELESIAERPASGAERKISIALRLMKEAKDEVGADRYRGLVSKWEERTLAGINKGAVK